MSTNKVAISLTTGLEDPEQVTVALLTAVGAAESGRSTLMFMTKESVRLALDGVAVGVACDGCPPIHDLVKRCDAAGGRLLVCPICFNAKQLREEQLVANATLGGTVQLWEWIGDARRPSASERAPLHWLLSHPVATMRTYVRVMEDTGEVRGGAGCARRADA